MFSSTPSKNRKFIKILKSDAHFNIYKNERLKKMLFTDTGDTDKKEIGNIRKVEI